MIRFGILIVLVCAGLFGFWLYGRNRMVFEYETGEKPVENPMKGFVAWGENYRKDPYVAFAYVPVYWSSLETEEGVYDFEGLEERCTFAKWREDGVRLIFRVVADSPSDEKHMDIPQWLYEKMDGAGDWYDGAYGKGFSPDYRNKTFKEAHKRLIKALADRYGEDPQTAFFQLGSLGHWGEWHVNTDDGIETFPFQAVTDPYVEDYLAVLPSSKLLLRRPYDIGRREGLGLYNDSFGQPSSHNLWLSWIREGYVSDQNGETLSAMPESWKKAPSGGEFATDQERNWYFTEEQFPVTLDLLKKSHTTFLGPNAPKYGELSGIEKQNAETLLKEMGYAFSIEKCTVENLWIKKPLKVTLTIKNTGLAPLYEDWPLYFELRDSTGKTLWSGSYPAPTSQWLPGTHQFTAHLSGTETLPSGPATLYTGILDPLTNTPEIHFTMNPQSSLYNLGKIHLH